VALSDFYSPGSGQALVAYDYTTTPMRSLCHAVRCVNSLGRFLSPSFQASASVAISQPLEFIVTLAFALLQQAWWCIGSLPAALVMGFVFSRTVR